MDQQLKDLLAGRDTSLSLDRAALSLATIEFPGLEPEPYLQILQEHARRLSERCSDAHSGREFVRAANGYFFGEVGIRGNADDYYNPRNSCLNCVLSELTGIPITLSVLYIEVARRLGRSVRGIGLPGHFIVQYEDQEYSTYIDCFHGGVLLTPEDCLNMVQPASRDARLLAPVGPRQIVIRMANNLRGIYFSRREYAKALQVLELLQESEPGSAELFKQRGMVNLQMHHYRAASGDLRRYLELSPEASDKVEIEQQLKALARWMASVN